MRAVLGLFIASLLTGCSCGGNIESLCGNDETRAAECDLECDQADPLSCPEGFFCNSSGSCDQQCTQGGNECGEGFMCSAIGRCVSDGSCVGLQCNVVDCGSDPPTTISGTVYAPNGTLPLSGISVYVPLTDPGELEGGAVCERCGQLRGNPIVETETDAAGNFILFNVPAGDNIPVVIVSGKWRKIIYVSTVAECEDTGLTTTETSLPATTAEGDMPKIALSTGNADALECLVRKLGISDTEISTKGQPGTVHLFTDLDADDGARNGTGASQFTSGFAGGTGDFANAPDELWNSVDNLDDYDIVILSCEGRQYPQSKSQSDLDAVKAYADLGGRVFASHWHNIWIGGEQNTGNPGIPDWMAVADFNFGGNPRPDDLTADIDTVNNPKGDVFADWMVNVGGSTVRGELPVNDSRSTCDSVDNGLAESWVTLDIGPGNDVAEGTYVMNFQFTTPQDVGPADRCGKVVFSDMHVSADSDSNDDVPYPEDCADGDLTPQEKALAFMFFDLASCVQTPVE